MADDAREGSDEALALLAQVDAVFKGMTEPYQTVYDPQTGGEMNMAFSVLHNVQTLGQTAAKVADYTFTASWLADWFLRYPHIEALGIKFTPKPNFFDAKAVLKLAGGAQSGDLLLDLQESVDSCAVDLAEVFFDADYSEDDEPVKISISRSQIAHLLQPGEDGLIRLSGWDVARACFDIPQPLAAFSLESELTGLTHHLFDAHAPVLEVSQPGPAQ